MKYLLNILTRIISTTNKFFSKKTVINTTHSHHDDANDWDQYNDNVSF